MKKRKNKEVFRKPEPKPEVKEPEIKPEVKVEVKKEEIKDKIEPMVENLPLKPYQTIDPVEAEELSKKGFNIKEVRGPNEALGIRKTTYVFYDTEEKIKGGK